MVNKENKKPTMPSIEQVLNAIRQRDMFSGFHRYQYTKPGWYDLDNAMKIIEAIGKAGIRRSSLTMKTDSPLKISSSGRIATRQ